MSNDPIGIAGGLNQFVFVGNNPVNFRDPFGRCENGDKILGNIRAFYDALEIVDKNKWWVNDTFLEYLAAFSLSGHAWAPLATAVLDPLYYSVNGQRMPRDYFGNYAAGYQAGYADSPGLLTAIFLGGIYYASGPGGEPSGDEDSYPAIEAGFLAGREARMNRDKSRK